MSDGTRIINDDELELLELLKSGVITTEQFWDGMAELAADQCDSVEHNVMVDDD